jgi:hypothetical protein
MPPVYKSKLERDMGRLLDAMGVPYSYESCRIPYVKEHYYLPDFHIDNTYFIETKGRFLPVDRKKHLLLKSQHPDLDLRFAFQNPKGKLNKKSKTTYAEWCERHGFEWCGKKIPKAWFS